MVNRPVGSSCPVDGFDRDATCVLHPQRVLADVGEKLGEPRIA
jgi:hypothetical protein